MALAIQERRLIPESVSLCPINIHEGLYVLDIELQVVIFLLRVNQAQVDFEDLSPTIHEESPSLLKRDLRLYIKSKVNINLVLPYL